MKHIFLWRHWVILNLSWCDTTCTELWNFFFFKKKKLLWKQKRKKVFFSKQFSSRRREQQKTNYKPVFCGKTLFEHNNNNSSSSKYFHYLEVLQFFTHTHTHALLLFQWYVTTDGGPSQEWDQIYYKFPKAAAVEQFIEHLPVNLKNYREPSKFEFSNVCLKQCDLQIYLLVDTVSFRDLDCR